jgi:hypothetical protein
VADATFQDQVDRCLTALEAQQPAIHRLRRVPMDLIAEAVDKELRVGFLGRVLAWKDPAVQRALIAIAIRNQAIVAAPIADSLLTV